ncbi:dihydrodipicolinate reductase [Halioxenophilus aromaticivorans]|uniref:Dihydrodipicolinate reductase n=2 Tax=Halioxenophilus aromaticivorans TaxID=1306992 RepID=A0AAV3U901_9ALTE
MELVGLKVYSENKEGKDAGLLCGLKEIGVPATNNLEDIIAAQPDCALYMPEGFNVDELCHLLAAGINVITTRNEFFYGPAMDVSLREKIQSACLSGGTTIHATGSSPGFITEALPAVLTSLSRKLQCVTIDEYADIPLSTTPDMITQVMGFGQPIPDQFNQQMLEHSAGGFSQSLSALASALGLEITGIESKGEFGAAQSDVSLPGGAIIRKGTVAAMRITVAAMVQQQAKLIFRANWFCSTNTVPDFEVRNNGWRVQVDGDTPLNVTIDFPSSDQPLKDQMSGLTAHRAVNSIAAVCAAEPGIKSCHELGPVLAQFANSNAAVCG